MPENNLKIIFLSDIHQNIDAVRKIDFSQFDVILCGGDFIDSAVPDIETAKKIIDILPENTYVVPGNCDKGTEIIGYINKKLINIHKKVVKIKEIPVLGIGYSRSLFDDLKVYRKFFLENPERIPAFKNNPMSQFIFDSCGIQFTDNKILNISDFNNSIKKYLTFIDKFASFDEDEITGLFQNIDRLNGGIIVTHSPPFGALDKIDGLPNIGSIEIKKGIQKTKPRLVLCGHFHELAGISNIDGIPIFNPGAIKDNKFGIIEILADKLTTRVEYI
jgi:Icc-related predicted phosphoesterase